MHILFCKGLYSHVIGGILHYACWYEGPGKVASKKPAARLAVIFQEIQGEYKRQEIEHRLTNLRLSMFTDPAKPWSSKASLDVKAAEAKHLLPALLPLLERMFPDMLAEERQMLAAATSLEKLWDEADMFLSGSQYAKSLALGKEFLTAYKWLNSCSLEKGRNSFAIVANTTHSYMRCGTATTSEHLGASKGPILVPLPGWPLAFPLARPSSKQFP